MANSVEFNNFSFLSKNVVESFASSLSVRTTAFRVLVVGQDSLFCQQLKNDLNGMSSKKRIVELTLLQPRLGSEKISGIDVFEGTLLTFKSERLFDSIIYMGSLRVAHPLSEVVIRSRMLLKEGGTFISEEYTRKVKDKETFRWFFDSLDLIESVSNFQWPKSVHVHEHPLPTATASPVKKGHRKNLSVTSISGIFSRHRKTASTVTEGEINVDDLRSSMLASSTNSSMQSSPTQSSTGSVSPNNISSPSDLANKNISPMCASLCDGLDFLQRWEKFHEGDKFMNVAKEDAIIDHLYAVFGEENVIIKRDLPFFYHFLSAGLPKEAKNSSVLQSFFEKEEQRIKDKVIKPIGMLIIAQNR